MSWELEPAELDVYRQHGYCVREAVFAAEELGLTSSNIDKIKSNPTNPEVKRFLGQEGDKGKDLRVSNEWAYNIGKQVGNYGESFERNLGQSSPLKISRGINALWSQGGLQYAPPIR